MIKYFEKLEKKKYIDNIQSTYLINKIKKESTLDNYYIASKNIDSLLNYYEFQKQFIKLKRKYKYIKEQKLRQNQLNDYEIFINEKAEERRNIKSLKNNETKNEFLPENINMNYPMDNIEKENEINFGQNKKYEIKGLVIDDPKYRKKINAHIRNTLLQSIKDEGLYSNTEEDSEGDSNIKEPYNISNHLYN